MPWPKSTVPKFGNWDKSEDLSYSIIFDKARAEKERFLHLFEEDPKDILSEQSFYKNSNVGAGKKTPYGVFPDKARADRERILPTQQDKRHTHLQQNVLQNPELTSHVSCDKSWGLTTGPKSPSDVRILKEQKNSSTHQPGPWNQSDIPAYNSPFSTGAPSRQPLQSGATRDTAFFNERHYVDQEGTGYQGRWHAKSTNTPGRYMFEENPAIAKMSGQRGLEVSKSADMQRKHAVPKFGDWDSGDRFTAVFNKVRIEKNSKYSLNPRAKAVSPLRPTDEDLYKSSEGSVERKKRRGWFRIRCCSEPSPQSADL